MTKRRRLAIAVTIIIGLAMWALTDETEAGTPELKYTFRR